MMLFAVRQFLKTLGRSAQWPALRRRWLADHPTCAACGGTRDLEVHHVKPFHLDPARELDPTNLITLCESGRRCHLVFGHLGNWKLEDPKVRELSGEYLDLISTDSGRVVA